MREDKAYIVTHDLSTGRVIHYIAVSHFIGGFRLINLNTYKILPGRWDTIEEIKNDFKCKEAIGEISIEYSQDILKFAE